MTTAVLDDLPTSVTTDALFQTWCTRLHTVFAGVGLVATADTGQVDLTTVVKPTAVNTFAGYKIYRFADTLQAAQPIFIKVEWGVSVAVTYPAMRIQTGAGTDGAGNLTGYKSTQQIIGNQYSTSGYVVPATTNKSFFSCGPGFFHAFIYAVGHGTGQYNFMGFSLSRSCDEAGARTADAYQFIAHRPNNSYSYAFYGTTIEHVRPPINLSWRYDSCGAYIVPPAPRSYTQGQSVTIDAVTGTQVVFPMWLPSADRLFPAMPDLVAIGSTQVRGNMEFDAQWHGATKHYKVVGQLGQAQDYIMTAPWANSSSYPSYNMVYAVEWPIA